MSVRLTLLLVAALSLLGGCAPPKPQNGASATDSASNDASASPQATVHPEDDAGVALVRQSLATHIPSLKIDDIRPSPMAGVYEIRSGVHFGYVSADGRYLIDGSMMDLTTKEPLTDERRREARKDLIAKLSPDRMIRFAPEHPKYEVVVFTDIDCPYCRMLHSQIQQYMDQGIAVNYVFFPRSGPGSPSFKVEEQIWCSADHKQALTDAKKGKALTAPTDCANPVMDDWKLAGDLDLTGTPAIILPSGDIVPGYRPPEDLRQLLDSQAAAAGAKTAANG